MKSFKVDRCSVCPHAWNTMAGDFTGLSCERLGSNGVGLHLEFDSPYTGVHPDCPLDDDVSDAPWFAYIPIGDGFTTYATEDQARGAVFDFLDSIDGEPVHEGDLAEICIGRVVRRLHHHRHGFRELVRETREEPTP